MCRPLLFLLSLLLHACHSEGGEVAEATPTLRDVSFAAVASLAGRPSDVRLAYGSAPAQYAELWLSRASARSPLLVFIHGGCWLNEFSIDHAYPLASDLAGRGYNVLALEYRRLGDPGGGWPGSLADILAGIALIPDLDQDISRSPLVLLGHSAGGHLALLAGVEMSSRGAAPDLLIGLAAISDLPGYARGVSSCEQAAAAFMSTVPGDLPAAERRANPAVLTLPPNSWLLHGSADSIVPLAQARHPDAHTLVEDGAGHFDWIHPGSAAYGRLLDLLDEQLQ